MFWRVRFERQGRVLVGFKARAAQDPVRGATTTAKWREDPTPDPENSVLGLLYECYPASGAFTICLLYTSTEGHPAHRQPQVERQAVSSHGGPRLATSCGAQGSPRDERPSGQGEGDAGGS